MTSLSKLLAIASLSSLAAFGVQAESYEGVHAPTGERARSAVAAEALAAAAAPNPFAEGYGQGVQAATSPLTDRAAVHAQAVAAAHDPTRNLDAKAFVNSRIPAQYLNGSLVQRRAGTQTQAVR